MTMSKRDRMILSAIGAVAVIGGSYWFLVKPAKAQATAHRAELESIQSDTDLIREQIARLQRSSKDVAARTVEGFKLNKALPDDANVPGAIVQLQRMAERTDVQLSVVRTATVSNLGALRVTDLEVQVTGRFWDVDDFMHRVHRTVSINAKNTPVIQGRLFAIKSASVDIQDEGSGSTSDKVDAILHVLAFANPQSTAGTDTASAGTTVPGTATPTPGGTP